ncbi:AmmeMemoRadiSam system protein A [Natroniella sulfidigena]|uniref:AmmeMemoRadiSam system protein A n=1 Tax=Natroniella sulfidigena TaxID=723921 RepID=UPI00200B3C0D|nr:AmmeMemoRadiSam system protein A [Natroniella sulfidigena]MCK8816173.1 AmmeMemoRadiSam system protein A [Natroniella sulfidigena]
MTGTVFAGLAPHPPILVPEIGLNNLEEVEKTKESMQQFARQLKESDPDLIITISPHGPVFSDAISILSQQELVGDFAQFGHRDLKFSYQLEEELTQEIIRASNRADITVARIDQATARKIDVDLKLDHGVLVPLYYLKEAGIDLPLIPITMGMLSYEELYKFGKVIQLVAQRAGYKVAVVASGDLSHRLTTDAPAGFNPRGREFDEAIVEYLDDLEVEEVFNLDPSLIEKAGECGLRPLIIMLGAIDGLDVEGGVLSYQGPFGVGYAVASYRVEGKTEGSSLLEQIIANKKVKLEKIRENESEVVRLARKTVEEYAKNKEVIDPPSDLDPRLTEQAGVFVSIKKDEQLRGCIGTTEPTQANIAEEVINNALSAAFKDPRFESVNLNELEELTYSVDILGEPEKIENIEQLDPKKYGVIVKQGERTGLLLPDLEGVNTATKQVEIAKRKAGISSNEDGIELMRFTVTRHT